MLASCTAYHICCMVVSIPQVGNTDFHVPLCIKIITQVNCKLGYFRSCDQGCRAHSFLFHIHRNRKKLSLSKEKTFGRRSKWSQLKSYDHDCIKGDKCPCFTDSNLRRKWEKFYPAKKICTPLAKCKVFSNTNHYCTRQYLKGTQLPVFCDVMPSIIIYTWIF